RAAVAISPADMPKCLSTVLGRRGLQRARGRFKNANPIHPPNVLFPSVRFSLHPTQTVHLCSCGVLGTKLYNDSLTVEQSRCRFVSISWERAPVRGGSR